MPYIDCAECGFEWLLPSEVTEVEINDELFYVCQNSDCKGKLIKRLTGKQEIINEPNPKTKDDDRGL